MQKLLKDIFRFSYYRIYGKTGKNIRINEKVYTVSAFIARGVKRKIDEMALKLFINLAKNANIVFDIGANVGVISTIVAKEMKPGTIMYSFEPAPTTYKYLADTARVQKGNARIETCNTAISNNTGKLYFTNEGNACTNHIASADDSDTVTVDSTTLDSFCTRTDVVPDVIKIDVEGAEYWALEGMQQLLRKKSCIVLMEIHSLFLSKNKITGAMFARIIDNIGYRVFSYDGREVRGTDIPDMDCIVLAREKPVHAFFNIA